MNQNIRLYEIDTRVWINQFGKDVKLSEIPIAYFENLKKKGFYFIWLMGIWKTPKENIKYAFAPELIKAYKKCLADWRKQDVIGSPYAIEDYEVNPKLGDYSDLKKLKKQLNKIGLKLILDFIPNHYSCESSIVKNSPHLFLPGDEKLLNEERTTYFKLNSNEKIILAHGRDPFFPAWSDTAQLNYFSGETRSYMTEQLLKLTKYCDGVRCDMAMLMINNIFKNTWPGAVKKFNFKPPKNEFWLQAISKLKEIHPNFILIGEVYWDLEAELLKLGFDFVYYKHFLDMLINNDSTGIKNYLKIKKNDLDRSVLFLENHDEERVVTAMGQKKSKAAAVSMFTVPGMKLVYDGQLEGLKLKYPVQLGRKGEEKISTNCTKFYDKLLELTNDEIYAYGSFKVIETVISENNDDSCKNIFAWYWSYEDKIRLTVINYSSQNIKCKIKLPIQMKFKKLELIDMLTDAKLKISSKKLNEDGFTIQLKPYQSRIVKVEKKN